MRAGDFALTTHHFAAHIGARRHGRDRLGDFRGADEWTDIATAQQKSGRTGFPIEHQRGACQRGGDRFTIVNGN